MVTDPNSQKAAYVRSREKIGELPFTMPGGVMKRALNFEALKAVHPQIYSALMANPVFRLHPEIKSANHSILDHIYSDYCDEQDELSDFMPEVGWDSQYTDEFLKICNDLGKPLPFAPNTVVPFLTYHRADSINAQDTICVTADELLIFTNSPQTAHCIPLEDIQTIVVTDRALVINGVSYPLKCTFAPLQEKTDLLVFFVGMILSMKYPAQIPADDPKVVFEPTIHNPKGSFAKPQLPKTGSQVDDAMKKIAKAKKMLADGVLTEAEFSAIKARILKEL